MAISVSICAAASMIIKPCYQESTNEPQLRRWSDEKKTSCGSHEFRMSRSGGRDGDDANIPVNRKHEGKESRGTQTDYRESEAQTSPWEAPYKLSCRASMDENPEVLSLANSTWENGLPAGMHEVKIIQRMRMKKKWLEILPPMDTPSNIKISEAIISAIEANEWAFREAEIQSIMDSRMELMERIMEHNAKVREERTVRRIKRLASRLGQQRDKQILDIRGTFLREVRKLNRKHRASSAASYKMHRSDIIARYANPTSYLYAPKMHFGFGTKARHEILDKTLLPETYVDRKIEDDSTTWLPTDEELQNLESIRRPDQLCVRRTRWTDEKLRKLHSDLKAIRLNDTKNQKRDRPTLMKRKYKLPALPVTPLIRRSDDGDNYWENNSSFLQKITRGRAVQCMMFEGRDRCRELIEELRSTHLLKDSEDVTPHRSNGVDRVDESREESEILEQNNRLSEILDSLEGLTVAGILDMLSKEETRLREERKAHALALLVERERTRREAEESGRRQLERNRRRELDEMFRQMVKVHQDTVQAYLEDVISEEIERTAERDASQYVEELADEIDAATLRYQEQEPDEIRDRQMITDMVHNFLIPEVDKQITRKEIHDREQKYLREAHFMIYNEMKNSGSSKTFEDNSEALLKTECSVEDAEDSEENESSNDEDIHLRDGIKKLT